MEIGDGLHALKKPKQAHRRCDVCRVLMHSLSTRECYDVCVDLGLGCRESRWEAVVIRDVDFL
jgi:hypothetical protein